MSLVDASEYAASQDAQTAEKAAMDYQTVHPETSSYLPGSYQSSPSSNGSVNSAIGGSSGMKNGVSTTDYSDWATYNWNQMNSDQRNSWESAGRNFADLNDGNYLSRFNSAPATPSGGVSIDGTTVSQPSSSMPSEYQYDYTTRAGDQVANDGQNHLNVGGTPQADVKVSQGQSYGSAQDIASSLGLQYKRDPQGNVTLNGTSFLPIGFDKQGNPMLNYRDVADAMGYKVNYDDASKTISIQKPPTTQTPATPGAVTTGQIDPNQVKQVIPNVGFITADGKFHSFNNQPAGGGLGGGFIGQLPAQPQMPGTQGGWNTTGGQMTDPNNPNQTFNPIPGENFSPDLSGYNSQLMPYQQFNPQWDNYYNSAHNQLDPQYQQMAQKLNDQLGTNVTKMNESMNHRGIFTSGIAQAAENDLRAKTTNAVASVFIKEQGAIEKQAQTLYQNAFKAYQSGNQFALKNNQFVVQQMMNDRKQTYTEWLGGQKLNMQQYQYALNAWDKMSTMIWHNAQMQQSGDQFNQKMGFDQFKFDNLSANQTSTLQQQYDKMNQDMQKAQLPYMYQTANNAANNQAQNWRAMLPYQLQTANSQASTQLEMWKMLGYIQNADGTLTPTEQTNNNNQNLALNWAKAMGYTTNADGTIVPTEQARHDMATENLTANGQTITANHNAATEQAAADSLRLRLNDMMGYDQNGTPTLKRDQFNEMVSKDSQTIQIAKDNATTSANKSIVDGIGRQLTAVNSQFNAIITSGSLSSTDPNAKSEAQSQLKTLSDKRDSYLNQLSQYTNQGFSSNFPPVSQ